MSETYLEKCIQKLPAEKQSAARAAVRDIAETGEDSLLSKLLLVFEANAAYAETIPHEMVRFGEAFLRELDGRTIRAAQEQKEVEAKRTARLVEVISEQVPQLGKNLALDKFVTGLNAQTATVTRLERSVARLRHARIGGLFLLLALGAAVGAGAVAGIFWKPYDAAQRAQRFVSQLTAAGVTVGIDYQDNAVHLTLDGPTALRGTAWRKNGSGYISGAEFVFPMGEAR